MDTTFIQKAKPGQTEETVITRKRQNKIIQDRVTHLVLWKGVLFLMTTSLKLCCFRGAAEHHRKSRRSSHGAHELALR